jgi:hypothetical protein
VRIEGLDLEEPVVGVPVQVQELEAVREALDGREVFLVPDELSVDDVGGVGG